MKTLQLISTVRDKLRKDGFFGLIAGARAALRHRTLNHLFFNRFDWWQRRGMHVVPVSYWSPIPDTRKLNQTLWNDTPELSAIDVREEAQLDFLSICERDYSGDYSAFPDSQENTTAPYQYYTKNGTFETVDGEVLYCMVRESTPDQVIQLGGGFSTRVLSHALRDGSINCSVKVFEPYRDDWLTEKSSDRFTLVGDWADEVGVDWFDTLSAADILFVDSSHVLRIGNNLYRLLFDVIPRLPEGILIHFHDIFLPHEYPKEWVLERKMFLNEQYALRAFLAFNHRIDVRWMGGYMHKKHPEALASTFDSYDPSLVGAGKEMNIPNSIWLETTD